MNINIKNGASFTQEMIVGKEDTAVAHGSGRLEVFATPAMVAFMENTALKCLDGMLDENSDTVGIKMNVEHIKATAVGKKVDCTARIISVDNRLIRFEIEANDEVGKIGEAVHDRFLIDPIRFMSKL